MKSKNKKRFVKLEESDSYIHYRLTNSISFDLRQGYLFDSDGEPFFKSREFDDVYYDKTYQEISRKWDNSPYYTRIFKSQTNTKPMKSWFKFIKIKKSPDDYLNEFLDVLDNYKYSVVQDYDNNIVEFHLNPGIIINKDFEGMLLPNEFSDAVVIYFSRETPLKFGELKLKSKNSNDVYVLLEFINEQRTLDYLINQLIHIQDK